MPAAHESLDRVDRAFGIRDRLAAGQISDEDVSLIGERHDAGGEPVAFLVRNNLRLFAFHHRHDGIRRAEVDPDNFFALSHCRYAPFDQRPCREKDPLRKGRVLQFRSEYQKREDDRAKP